MPDDPKPLSEWARKRAAGKARRASLIAQREAYFDLLLSGHTVEQIAQSMNMSASAVRRAVGQAIDARRLDRPERYAKIQIARLTKALRSADAWLDQGELDAIEPFLKVVSALDRYHGPADPAPRRSTASRPAALTHADACGAGSANPPRRGRRARPTIPAPRAKEVATP